ncbi:unnamed protein product, partial [Ectocarpus sp. 12 AP-2014]
RLAGRPQKDGGQAGGLARPRQRRRRRRRVRSGRADKARSTFTHFFHVGGSERRGRSTAEPKARKAHQQGVQRRGRETSSSATFRLFLHQTCLLPRWQAEPARHHFAQPDSLNSARQRRRACSFAHYITDVTAKGGGTGCLSVGLVHRSL